MDATRNLSDTAYLKAFTLRSTFLAGTGSRPNKRNMGIYDRDTVPNLVRVLPPGPLEPPSPQPLAPEMLQVRLRTRPGLK